MLFSEPNYYFTEPQARFVPNYPQNEYVNPQDISAFPHTSPGFSYEPDLDTSDLPSHLQQTLPQYRFSGQSFTTKEPRYQNSPEFAFTYQPVGLTTKQAQKHRNNPELSRHPTPITRDPAPFRPQYISSQQIRPSTHKPNYSHLFSQQHNRDPSETETFLGQITIQSPAELPPEFNSRGFKPSLEFPTQHHNKPQRTPSVGSNELAPSKFKHQNQNLDYHDKSFGNNAVQVGTASRGNFLNHRTRIFAPDANKASKTRAKDYFINSNGDVYITTKIPFSPKPTVAPVRPTTLKRKNTFVPSTKSPEKPISFNIKPTKIPFVPKKPAFSTTENMHLEYLLEDPIDNEDIGKQSDDVEVIQSATVPPDQLFTVSIEPTTLLDTTIQEYSTTNQEEETTQTSSGTEYGQENEEATTSTEINNEYITVSNENDTITTELQTSTVEETLTSKENSTENDTTTSKPTTIIEDVTYKELVDGKTLDTTQEPQPTLSNENIESINHMSNIIKPEADSIILGGSVVSVVTTKSVINNTMIISATPSPQVTRQMYSPNTSEVENSTDSWIVVASVQTSRSVSGARYLPSSIVEQKERNKLLNEPDEYDTSNEGKESFSDETGDNYTTIAKSTTSKPNTSTESLTDKLDRVQSDLSSGLLTGGFNNIAVIKEAPEKNDETTVLDVTTTTTTTTTSKPTLPPVVIRKFSAHARPSTTLRPKKIFDSIKRDDLSGLLPAGFKPKYQNRKSTTTTRSTVDLDIPQGDEPAKIEPSLESLRSKIKFQETSLLLPPGYKAAVNTTQQPDLTSLHPAGYSNKNKTEKVTKTDLSASLPSGYVPAVTTTSNPIDKLLSNVRSVDISALLPPGYKPPTPTPQNPKTIENISTKARPVDISAFLPPGYKPPKSATNANRPSSSATLPKPKNIGSLTNKARPTDISALLPPGYKFSKTNINKTTPTTRRPKETESVLAKAEPVDISALLPPGYKPPKTTTAKSKNIVEDALVDDISVFLPPGYKSRSSFPRTATTTETTPTTEISSPNPNDAASQTTKNSGGFKLVFPSRPGAGSRKSSKRLTTPKPVKVEGPVVTPPSIQKGWPSR